MSNGRPFRRRLTDSDVPATVKASAHRGGCTCDVEIDTPEATTGIIRCTARHDPWCPLLRRVSAANN